MIKKLGFFGSLVAYTLLNTGCPGKLARATPATDNVSMSEIAEAVVSGAVVSTWGNGTQASIGQRENSLIAQIKSSLNLSSNASAAYSAGGCATVQQGDLYFAGVDCVTAVTPPTLTLNYSPPCNMGTPFGVWSGGQIFTATAGTIAFACGAPQPYVAGLTLSRVFQAPSGRIANPQQLNAVIPGFPINVLVDTSQLCILNNSVCAGYSQPVNLMQETIVFQGAVQRQISINGIHLSGLKDGYVVWDFTVSTPAASPLQIDASNNVVSGGPIIVQNNISRVTVSAAIQTSLSYSAGCGVPTGGALKGTLVTNPAIAGDGSLAGPLALPETLTFSNSCGAATLVNTAQPAGAQYTLYHAY